MTSIIWLRRLDTVTGVPWMFPSTGKHIMIGVWTNRNIFYPCNMRECEALTQATYYTQSSSPSTQHLSSSLKDVCGCRLPGWTKKSPERFYRVRTIQHNTNQTERERAAWSLCLHHLSPERQGHSPPQAHDSNTHHLSAINSLFTWDIHVYLRKQAREGGVCRERV